MGDRAWAGTQARPGKGQVLAGDSLESLRKTFPVSFPVFPDLSLSLAPSAHSLLWVSQLLSDV